LIRRRNIAVIKLLDPKIKQIIETTLENQYKYIDDEKHRKEMIRKELEKSEEEILRRIPVTVRQRIINILNAHKKGEIPMLKERWLSQTEAKSFINTKKIATPDFDYNKLIYDATHLTMRLNNVTFDKDNKTPILSIKQVSY
jgi:hypothetical protein